MNDSARNAAFAKKLKQIMEQKELTQSALAARIWGRRVNDEGIDVAIGRDRISVWASGHTFPDAMNLEKLAQALGVTVADLEPES